jgi:hypothetical protein
MKQNVSLITLGVSDCGRTITRAPTDTFYGGYAGVFRDLDGHASEIAHNPGFGLAADGSVLLGERG